MNTLLRQGNMTYEIKRTVTEYMLMWVIKTKATILNLIQQPHNPEVFP